jgi:hypothetical protein
MVYMPHKALSKFQERLLYQLSPLIIPTDGPQVPNFQAKVTQRVDRFFFELPPVLRILFSLGMRLFDAAAIVFAHPHRCFQRLSESSRLAYIRRMSRSWFRPVRDWLFTCRGLILLFYYCQPEVMAALHYDPRTWAREKIQARRETLHLTEKGAVTKTYLESEKAQRNDTAEVKGGKGEGGKG